MAKKKTKNDSASPLRQLIVKEGALCTLEGRKIKAFSKGRPCVVQLSFDIDAVNRNYTGREICAKLNIDRKEVRRDNLAGYLISERGINLSGADPRQGVVYAVQIYYSNKERRAN